jgi:SAM-dependent methyltransferase
MNFNLYSKYYDLLYSDKDYLLETEYVVGCLNELSDFEVKSVLELGGGSGNHAKYLTNYFDIINGVELSPKMVQIALDRKIPNYKVLQGDITIVNYPNQQFDCAISLFHVISYLNTNEQLINCFKAVHNQIKSGGIFIFDVWYTPAVYSLKPETRVKTIFEGDINITRIAKSEINYESSIVNVNYSIFVEDLKSKEYIKFDETHSMRHFTTNEIKFIAEYCGFEIVNSEEFLSKKSPSNETWGVMFALKKK